MPIKGMLIKDLPALIIIKGRAAKMQSNGFWYCLMPIFQPRMSSISPIIAIIVMVAIIPSISIRFSVMPCMNVLWPMNNSTPVKKPKSTGSPPTSAISGFESLFMSLPVSPALLALGIHQSMKKMVEAKLNPRTLSSSRSIIFILRSVVLICCDISSLTFHITFQDCGILLPIQIAVLLNEDC